MSNGSLDLHLKKSATSKVKKTAFGKDDDHYSAYAWKFRPYSNSEQQLWRSVLALDSFSSLFCWMNYWQQPGWYISSAAPFWLAWQLGTCSSLFLTLGTINMSRQQPWPLCTLVLNSLFTVSTFYLHSLSIIIFYVFKTIPCLGPFFCHDCFSAVYY